MSKMMDSFLLDSEREKLLRYDKPCNILEITADDNDIPLISVSCVEFSEFIGKVREAIAKTPYKYARKINVKYNKVSSLCNEAGSKVKTNKIQTLEIVLVSPVSVDKIIKNILVELDLEVIYPV